MKSLALKLAHSLRKSFASWASCLSYAWKLAKLKFSMLKGVVEFAYTKVDGTLRNAVGTLSQPFVDYEFKGKASSTGVFSYFDVDQGAFRCFKIENLI